MASNGSIDVGGDSSSGSTASLLSRYAKLRSMGSSGDRPPPLLETDSPLAAISAKVSW